MKKYDYIIAGNGILSLFTAYRIVKESNDVHVCIVGPKKHSGSASLAAGAMLGVFGEMHEGSLSDNKKRFYFEMAREASKMWDIFVDEINPQLPNDKKIKISKNGTYVLLNSKGTSLDDNLSYEAMINALEEYGEPYQNCDTRDVEGLYPIENSRPLKSLYINNERFINPEKVFLALEYFIRKNKNVTFMDHCVDKLFYNENSHHINGLEMDNGEKLFSDTIIVAAGSATQKILNSIPLLYGRIPYILSGSGISFLVDQAKLTPKINHVLRTPNRGGACGVHVVPRDDDKLYIGAGNMMDWEYKPGGLLESCIWVLDSASREFNRNLIGTRITDVFFGSRPFSIDGHPILGQCSTIKGLWILSGTGRDGFHCAPTISLYLVSQLIPSKKLLQYDSLARKMTEYFSPERPLIQNYTMEKAIKKSIHQIYCVLHETGGLLTTGLHKPFPNWIEKHIMDIYDKLGTRYALHPLLLLPMICGSWDLNKVKAFLSASEKIYFSQKGTCNATHSYVENALQE